MTRFINYYQSEALKRTRAAQQELHAVSELLREGLKRQPKVRWDELKNHASFSLPRPVKPLREPSCSEPTRDYFKRSLTLLEWVVPPLARSKEEQAARAYENAHRQWEEMVRRDDEEYGKRLKLYKDEEAAWEQGRREFPERQRLANAAVDVYQAGYAVKDPPALLYYCTQVLTRSQYPPAFPRSFELEYLPESKTVITDFQLPRISVLPTVKEVKYVSRRDEFRNVPLSTADLARTYDDVLYQIALRTLWELFVADSVDALDAVVFNGWVDAIDKATGKDYRACVLSVQSSKAEFLDIHLASVDPKICFKKLKGISGSRLADVVPVRPVLQISRDDRRFVPGYAVVDALDRGTNLASMDWLDFENLIRELFQKEFAKNGGEVKITQASRDGGVDAIAFDPDPIRGGKIVIQAKRYTNTVGVSAVRDLYGTIINEGANTGILVTTAEYGRDAYDFAQGKPIKLLSGSELLHLLEQHGHRARIDLAEARKLERERIQRR